jgi:hypothetical protein
MFLPGFIAGPVEFLVPVIFPVVIPVTVREGGAACPYTCFKEEVYTYPGIKIEPQRGEIGVPGFGAVSFRGCPWRRTTLCLNFRSCQGKEHNADNGKFCSHFSKDLMGAK